MQRTLIILLAFASLAALALPSPTALAFQQSPIPRPTLDPTWVCRQLGNCPTPKHVPHRKRAQPNVILLPMPKDIEPNHLIRLP